MAKRHYRSTSVQLETLEKRLFLSSVTTDVSNHTVVFTGDNSAESIGFVISSGKIYFSVTGSIVSGNVGWDITVTKYVINAGGGNDSFTTMPVFIGDTPVPIAYAVSGGEGNDVIYGGSWNDTLSGGAGDDQLLGGGGADSIRGGIGTDSLWGDGLNDTIADGDDTLIGGDGDDVYGFDDNATSQIDYVEELAGQGTDSLDFNNETNSVFADLRGGYSTTGKIAWTAYRQVFLYTLGGEANWERIVGGSAADTLAGNRFANRLSGEGGADNLLGDGGNDTLIGQKGVDTLSGGSGEDLLQGNGGPDSIVGGGGHDTLEGGAGSNTLVGGTGDDVYAFGNTTARQVDYVEELAGQGTETLQFGNETHTVWADLRGTYPSSGKIAWTQYRQILLKTLGREANWEGIIGGPADDLFVGHALANTLLGGGGADSLRGEGGDDMLKGEGGADSLAGGLGNDYIDGGEAADYISGGAGNDSLAGNSAGDTIYGGDGHDLIGGDVDTSTSGAGADELYGQEGNDTLRGGAGSDTLDGGAGTNFLDFSAESWRTTGVIARLGTKPVGGEWLANIEHVLGTKYNDTLIASSNATTLQGGNGNDLLVGGAANDVLDGGTGADTMRGGDADDTIYARDNIIDSIDGGAGTDFADYDGIKDVLTNVERMFRVAADLEATVNEDGQVSLGWRDLSDNETGFKIQRSDDNAVWTTIKTTAAGATGYLDTTLLPAGLYYYRICATNADGDSPFFTTAVFI